MSESPKFSAADIKDAIRQITAPVFDSVENKLNEQIAERVTAVLNDTVEQRLALLERAVADLDRAVRALEER
jgi:type III secretory pathway component EscV